MLVPGLARDTLVWATDHTDPVTCLGASAGAGEVLAMGTAAGSVRIFFLQRSEWKSVLLCARSEEAVVGLCFREDESELSAVVGDVCVKVWDLTNLQPDESGGCRVGRRIEFALIHSLDYCSSTCTLVDGDSVLVMRNNGEGCLLNLSSQTASSLFQDFGPLPAMNSLTLPVGMRGNRHVVFASSSPASQSLSVWPIVAHGQQPQPQQRAMVLPPSATVGGRCVLVLEDELLFLLHGELCLLRWRGGGDGEKPREIARGGGIVSFDFQPLTNRLGFVTQTGLVGTALLGEDAALHEPKQVHAKASFHFNLPYLVVLVGTEGRVLFNDDLGVHVVNV